MKNKLIKWAAILFCVLFLILILVIIFAKPDSTTPQNNPSNIETSVDDNQTSDLDTSETDDDNTESNDSSNQLGTNNEDNQNPTQDNQNVSDDGDPNDPNDPNDNDGKPLNPDATVVGWDEIKYPKDRMQKIIDQIARASTIMEKKTGECIFTMKTQDISTKGMVVYVSEYGKYNLFPQNVQMVGNQEIVSYPDEVIFGFALFLGGNFKPEEMNTWEEDKTMWRDKLTKATTYCYPSTEPEVVDTFEFISCADFGTSIDMTVKGKGKFAGSNYILRLHQQFDGLWAVLSLTKI